MNGAGRGDPEGGRPRPLSMRALQARRTASRRRRARGRAAAGVLGLTGLVLVVVGATLLLTGASGGPRHRRTIVSASKIPGRPGFAYQHQSSVAPAALIVDRILRYTSYISAGTPRRREVALTFDDGPSPYTPRILRILKRTRTPATFFVIGEWARRFPQFVRAETQTGCEVGDHTETHPFMAELSRTQQQAEIVDAADDIHRAGAPYPSLWRPPYGSFNGATLSILHQLRMLIVLWTVDTSDYIRPGVARIRYVALSGARPGAIILMHDGGGDRSETVAALPRIIVGLRRRGYRLVTVSQLLTDDPPPSRQPQPHSLAGG
jgi:peptidoglycan/xylan/chitin deacetylase (PgdA/CDA1 family)